MKAKEAHLFYEEDEDPKDVFAAFDAGQKDLTSPERPAQGPVLRIRHELAVVLRRLANVIDPPRARA